jgi:hypothetical protein
MMRCDALLASYVPDGICIEASFAASSAEEVPLAAVFTCARGGCRINLHSTDNVCYGGLTFGFGLGSTAAHGPYLVSITTDVRGRRNLTVWSKVPRFSSPNLRNIGLRGLTLAGTHAAAGIGTGVAVSCTSLQLTVISRAPSQLLAHAMQISAHTPQILG